VGGSDPADVNMIDGDSMIQMSLSSAATAAEAHDKSDLANAGAEDAGTAGDGTSGVITQRQDLCRAVSEASVAAWEHEQQSEASARSQQQHRCVLASATGAAHAHIGSAGHDANNVAMAVRQTTTRCASIRHAFI
jgi:hypothetical protein